MYADIIVDISAENLDKTYQYSIPDALVDTAVPGTPVVIPFGRGNRSIKGFIVGLSDIPKIDQDKIKPIKSIEGKANSIDSRMIALAWWIKEQFGSTMNDALRTVIPVKRSVEAKLSKTIKSLEEPEKLTCRLEEAEKKHHVAKVRFLTELISSGSLDYGLVTGKLGISTALIRKFTEEGVITVETNRVYRNPFNGTDRNGYVKPVLNPGQRSIADEIIGDLESGIRRDYLIHGITGSGKTEIYMEVIDKVLEQGRQVIMLIPEIALTYQTVKRFYMRFGDRISIINSKLSGGERYDQYLRAKNGEADIVIGPRSALFTPFPNPGLIIIDEEHESSYNSESAPRYKAGAVALKRAEMENASVILGSATPSMESYTMAKAGRLKLFTLDKRAGNASYPHIHVVDMRKEMKEKNRSIFSRKLKELISEKLEKHEQSILFLNRRGYSGFLSCRSCGKVIKCPHCDISLTVHNDSTMVCHYCGYTIPLMDTCPDCGSKYMASFGIGTQKVEEMLKNDFPGADVLRLDADTTKKKNGYEEVLSKFANQEADILIGTQMIVKGHDFHNCTLVGILMADMSLFVPDFRSGERTFQLLTQASGRAGRGSKAGDVVIQTYNPDNYCIQTAARADYLTFYSDEMALRRTMDYPPARCMLVISIEDKDEAKADEAARGLATRIRTYFSYEKEMRKILGPVPGTPAKANDLYIRIIIIKAGDYGLLLRIKNDTEQFLRTDFDDENAVSAGFTFN
ncbi:MAG: primosomal protein N' [Lachnospiraceae bacterium]|nr:primosomal protein N' [Lachnospiraceae bacterium]